MRLAFPALISLAALLVSGAACGGDSSTDAATVVLLDQTFPLHAAEACADGGVSMDFSGTAGRTITAEATGPSNMTPVFVLYAPDFATQIAVSSPNGSGKAKLIFTLTLAGTHHITLCEATGVSGSVRMRVTAPVLTG